MILHQLRKYTQILSIVEILYPRLLGGLNAANQSETIFCSLFQLSAASRRSRKQVHHILVYTGSFGTFGVCLFKRWESMLLMPLYWEWYVEAGLPSTRLPLSFHVPPPISNRRETAQLLRFAQKQKLVAFEKKL